MHRALSALTTLAARYPGFLERHAGAVVLAFLVVTGFFGLSLRRLELRTDFQDLLPDGQPSVVALRRIIERVGGVGTLNIAIESEDKEASKRFAEDLVAAMRARMGGDLQSIDYTTTPVRRFFEKNGVLYLSPEDLRELDRALAEAIREAKVRSNPLYTDIEDDGRAAREEPPAQAALRTVEARLRQRSAAVDRFPEGYYLGEKGRLLAIFVRPAGTALEIRSARALTGKVERLVQELGPQRYHPSLRVGFTGSVKCTVEEHEAIARDLAGTSFLCIALVALAVWVYFRLVRVLALLSVTLVAGAVWAFGVAALSVGAINAQTAFLGSIIVGTGINYGIMILARFLEERREGRAFSAALETALRATLRPTLVAAFATSISFGVLGLAQMRSFVQFGLLGGLGIVICWALSYTALPAMLVLLERVPRLALRAGRQPRLALAYPVWLSRLPIRHAGVVVAGTVLLCLASGVLVVRSLPRALETDMNNLRNRASVLTGTSVLDDRIGAMMGETLIPAVVLARDPEQARRICRAFDELRARRPERPPIEWCRSIHSFLPDRQAEKLALVGRLRQRLDRTPRDLLPAEARARVEELRAMLEVRPLGLGDLPEDLRRRFRDKHGTEGSLALVAPGSKLSVYNVDDLFAYANALREIRLESGEIVQSSGEQVIFADILRTIGLDAPRTTVLAAAGVLLMLVVTLRRGRAIALVSGALGAGAVLMVGIGALLGVRYNFLNFVALPTTLGIGVDYAVNILERQGEDGPGSMQRALLRTGPPVFVASLTTIIGYAVLLTSSSLALASFGKLAILGELTCLAAALLCLPALVTLLERRVRRSAAARPAAEEPVALAAEPVELR